MISSLWQSAWKLPPECGMCQAGSVSVWGGEFQFTDQDQTSFDLLAIMA
jgi:hypothetical protein